MSETTRRLRALTIDALILAGIAVVLLASHPADAIVRTCLEDEFGNPLRRVYVEHFFRDYMTDQDGCVAIDASGTIEVRVHAHNPVVRMDDGGAFALPVSQVVRVADGQTRRITDQSEWFAAAENFRRVYDDGLRTLPPWNGAEFPSARVRNPSLASYNAGVGTLRSVWPDQGVAVRAWVEGASLVGTGDFSLFLGFPLVHLKQGDETDLDTIAHELGHALHFSRISNAVRLGLEVNYGVFLATDPDKFHCFERRTNPTVAWIEVFGLFAADWFATAGAADREQAFYDRAIRQRVQLLNPNPACEDREPGPMFGDDVEGAIYLALFHDFARHEAVGLDFVVESYVDCESMDFAGYASCIERRHGAGSAIYQALVSAAGCYGIRIDGAAPPILDVAEASDLFGQAVAAGDFNADGFEDLAIGAPYEDLGSIANAGVVNVLYGLPGGLSASCNQLLREGAGGVPGLAERSDRFGAALATGDFDGDGFDDLAVGAPGETVADVVGAGAVRVVHGSRRGLDASHTSYWYEGRSGMPGVLGSYDDFGAALAAGDFDGNGTDDLAIGVPREDVSGARDAGSVHLLFGRFREGLARTGALRLVQPDGSESYDRFGGSLAAGDLDGDRRDDLAVGAPGEGFGSLAGAGAVTVFLAPTTTAAATHHYTQGTNGIAGAAASYERFGESLAMADFDGDRIDDLAIGVPGDAVSGTSYAGSVAVLYGGNPKSPRNELWTQGNGVPDAPEASDRFGSALVAADFDDDGLDDLAIGVPYEDIGSIVDAGAVTVLYGRTAHYETSTVTIFGRTRTLSILRPAGLDAAGSQLWSAATAGVVGASEASDWFGATLAAGDFDGDGEADLAIGIPREDVGSIRDAGAVHELLGSSGGLSATGDAIWDQND